MNWRLAWCLSFGLLAGGLGLRAAEANPTNPAPQILIEAQSPDGEFFFDPAKNLAMADGGIIVRYGTAIVTARRAHIFEARGLILADGAVRVESEGQTWTGESITYDYLNKRVYANDFRTKHGPYLAAGDLVITDHSNQVFQTQGAYLTTDDYAEPAYRIKARKLTIVPGQRIEARGATLYVGKVPILYLPRYERNLTRHPNYFSFVPGYRSRYGAYLLGSYNWILNDRLDGALHLDYRTRRGWGGGPDVNLHLGPWGEGEFKYYYAYDEDVLANGYNLPLNPDRHRLWYLHRAEFTNDLTARLALRYQSDGLFLHDFFERDYQSNVQPSSFFEVNKLWRNWSLDVLAQPQLVNAFETVERLPELRLTGLRQRLGESPFYYESDSSFGWYRRQFADPVNLDYDAWRGDTYHQLVLPLTYFGWLQVTPRVGGRATHYSAAGGPGGVTREHGRLVFNTGVEFSTRAHRLWPGVRNRLLDLNGLRHIIEPSLNYAFVPTPSRRVPLLPQFDYELGSYRLLPLDFPDYHAIDSIDGQNVLRLGVRNRLQTKRNGGIENFFYWAVFTDWRLDPRAGQSRFSEVYSEVEFLPRSWIVLSQELRVDPNAGNLRELTHRLTLLPGDHWTVTLGNRYLRYDPAYPQYLEQNLYFSSIFYRLSENWAFRATHHFEGRDGRMEEQTYTVYRDMRSWTMALALRWRDERLRGDDFTIAFTLSLKAFPRYKVGQDADRPAYLLSGY
jgi:lipopolysaccharide assembly outer membrane protein LptD (OstA)